MSELADSIRFSISRYLEGGISVDDLTDLLPDGWDLDEANDPHATDLTLAAIGYLAGYQSGDRDEDDLRAALGELVWHTVEFEYPSHDLFDVLASRIAETIPVSVEGDSSPEEGFEQFGSQHPQTEHQTTTVLLH
jgi:hypothetical protein